MPALLIVRLMNIWFHQKVKYSYFSGLRISVVEMASIFGLFQEYNLRKEHAGEKGYSEILSSALCDSKIRNL